MILAKECIDYMKLTATNYHRRTSPVFDTIYSFLNQSEEKVEEILMDKSLHYLSYPIIKVKSNGRIKRRYIDAPQDPLKTLQEKILYDILYKFSAHPIAHGFVKNKSPKTAAEKHVGAKILICLDIKNFFHAIKYPRIVSLIKILLCKNPIIDPSTDNCKTIAELLTYRGSLPQGAPTSPTVSNLICLSLDKQLNLLQSEFNCVITRA